eukprot:m.335903 g.335903  ORF g.335903 m.335903 type:complete len:626 (+) comp17704_c0_seq1:168-2045(+)
MAKQNNTKVKIESFQPQLSHGGMYMNVPQQSYDNLQGLGVPQSQMSSPYYYGGPPMVQMQPHMIPGQPMQHMHMAQPMQQPPYQPQPQMQSYPMQPNMGQYIMTSSMMPQMAPQPMYSMQQVPVQVSGVNVLEEERRGKKRSADDYGQQMVQRPRMQVMMPMHHGAGQVLAAPMPMVQEHALSKADMRKFLSLVDTKNNPELEVTIVHSRVVQKSYGTEKRFFCPPPMVSLKGSQWQTEPQKKVFIYVGMTSDHSSNTPNTIGEHMCAVARNLFISDQDRRKRFCLNVKIMQGPNPREAIEIGSFISRPIKVISKPTRKKLTQNNTDLCINNGSEIAFFIRVKSQAGSTRYLTSTQGGFTSSTSIWGTFVVKSAASIKQGTNAFIYQSECINYNAAIVLECPTSGFRSPELVIKKVDKGTVEPDAEDPVSQLQKVALRVKAREGSYLGLQDGKVTYVQPTGKKGPADVLDDSCVWTVSSSDHVTYKFCDMRPPNPLQLPVDPVPLVQFTKNLVTIFEIYGDHFSDRLTVWFNDVPAKTHFRCPELLACYPPHIGDILGDGSQVCREAKTVPIMLVRDDGVIYPTGKKYTYEVDPVVMLKQPSQSQANADTHGTDLLLAASEVKTK